MKKEVRLGLIGTGIVGSNVLELLYENRSRIERKIGARIVFSYVCDKNRSSLSKVTRPRNFVRKKTTNWKKPVNDSSVDIIVELIGGINPAKQIITKSIMKNKHIVTANKAVLAGHWHELFSLAMNRQRLIYFEAAVAAGLPIIQALNEGLAANNVSSIKGILNGTCNYILTRMTNEGVEFNSALREAQKAGFAELNPYLDIEGLDTVHKLAILSSITWSDHVKPERVYCEGISDLSRIDVKFAKEEFGYTVKLLGIARMDDGRLELNVRPCLVPQGHPFSTVDNETNAILVEGDACGRIIFQGKGAGGDPAASAVVSDIMFLAQQVALGMAGRVPYVDYIPGEKVTYLKPEDSMGSYYLRFTAADKPGVLSQVSGILGKHKVSIASVYQKGPLSRNRKGVPILMLTHTAKEGSVRGALAEIDRLKFILKKSILLRIEK